MAKAKKAAPNTKEKDTQEFFEALALMGQEKGIPLEYLVEKIKTAIALAVKKDPAGSEESIVVIDPESKRFYVAMRKEVVEEVEDPAEFVSAALSPATVLSVEILEMNPPSCRVTVPDHQLSLAIGNKGQNARLAAKLTGWKIDIRPESGFYGEEPEEDAGDAPEEPEEEA